MGCMDQVQAQLSDPALQLEFRMLKSYHNIQNKVDEGITIPKTRLPALTCTRLLGSNQSRPNAKCCSLKPTELGHFQRISQHILCFAECIFSSTCPSNPKALGSFSAHCHRPAESDELHMPSCITQSQHVQGDLVLELNPPSSGALALLESFISSSAHFSFATWIIQIYSSLLCHSPQVNPKSTLIKMWKHSFHISLTLNNSLDCVK